MPDTGLGFQVEGPHPRGTSLGGVLREQQMLKGAFPESDITEYNQNTKKPLRCSRFARQRAWHTLKGVKVFNPKAKARIWP